MKSKTISVLMFALALSTLSMVFAAAEDRKANVLLQSGIAKETIQRDLKGAISDYEKAYKEAGANRALAAKALIHLAQAYQRLGDSEARRIYERVIREFGDQREAAQTATAGLATLAPGDALGTKPLPWTPPAQVAINGKVSPDGRLLPYVDWYNGVVWIRDLATGSTQRVISFGQGEYAENSVFSRDGRLLAYAWQVRPRDIYQLRVLPVSAAGEPAPRILFDNPEVSWLAPYDWTPDGDFIVVVIQRKDRTSAIGLVSTRNGSFQSLKSVDWDSVSNLALNPAGDWLAFDRRVADGSHDVFVMSIDGKREFPAVSYKADDTLVGWSPDGTRLLFLSDRSAAVDLWSIAVTTGKAAGEPVHLRSNVGRFWPVGVTPGGSVVGAATATGGAHLKVRTLDFEPGSPDTSRVLDEFLRGPSTPMSWSHNGRFLVSGSHAEGLPPFTPIFKELNRLSLKLRNTETGEVVKAFPADFAYESSIEWTPDDSTLIVAGGDLRGRTGLYAIDIATGQMRPLVLTEGEQPTMPVNKWRAVVGESLFYQRMVRQTQLAKVVEHDLRTGEERDVLPWAPRYVEQRSDEGPARSIVGVTPNREILYITHARPSGEILLRILSLDQNTDRVLMRASSPEKITVLDRLPQGNAVLAARSTATKQTEVWRVPLDPAGSPAKIATSAEDFSTLSVLGTANSGIIYLAKVAESGVTRNLVEVWSLSADGTLASTGTRIDIGFGSVGPAFRVSPDGRRLAFVTQYRQPAAQLELMVFEFPQLRR